MAYRGLAIPVIAKRNVLPDGSTGYSEGIICGSAIRVTIDPVYEDTSDYKDVNDTEVSKEFAYAKLTLDTSNLPYEAEQLMYGHGVTEDCVTSRDSDQAGVIGFGILVTIMTYGIRRYAAIWLHCVEFAEDTQNHNTRSNNSNYDTHQASGIAVPEADGIWRTKKIFKTKNEAVSWLKEMAGIKE